MKTLNSNYISNFAQFMILIDGTMNMEEQTIQIKDVPRNDTIENHDLSSKYGEQILYDESIMYTTFHGNITCN